MEEIKNKIYNKHKELNNRLNQLHYSKKEVKFYYLQRISEIKEEIKDLEAQLIYYNNLNNSNEIDIHGATRYFVDYYLYDMIIYKMEYSNNITLITGKGTKTLFNYVKTFLENEKFKFKVKDYSFIIKCN